MVDRQSYLFKWVLTSIVETLGLAKDKKITYKDCNTTIMMYCWIGSTMLNAGFKLDTFVSETEGAPEEFPKDSLKRIGRQLIIAMREAA
tara:strand:+ start:365 stop:631 length:267 start_codon:yes stop_codon:yes gene_type:complete